VCPREALIDVHAVVSIARVPRRAGALVAPICVDADGFRCTLVASLQTFVDVNALKAIARVPIVTDALEGSIQVVA
jgi:hypothetical protein